MQKCWVGTKTLKAILSRKMYILMWMLNVFSFSCNTRTLSSWRARSWRCHGYTPMRAGYEITPSQIVADAIRTICRHVQNLIGRQNTIPHVDTINVAKKALGLFKATPITILILAKDKNTVVVDHMSSFQTIAIFPKLAINVEVPRTSSVLPCCADVVPEVIIHSQFHFPAKKRKTKPETIKRPAHSTYLRFGWFCKFFGDFGVYLRINNFSQVISTN